MGVVNRQRNTAFDENEFAFLSAKSLGVVINFDVSNVGFCRNDYLSCHSTIRNYRSNPLEPESMYCAFDKRERYQFSNTKLISFRFALFFKLYNSSLFLVRMLQNGKCRSFLSGFLSFANIPRCEGYG